MRTYWSPDAVERVTGQPLTGLAEHGIIHLINSAPPRWTVPANSGMKRANQR